MKKILFGSAMLTLAFVGCQNDEFLQNDELQAGEEFTIEATQGASTRTELKENNTGYQTVWSHGDKIYMTSADKKVYAIMTLSSGAGESTAIFKGRVYGGAVIDLAYSVYPVPEDDEIDLTQREAGKPNAPMIATFDPANPGSIGFDLTCGMVAIEVSGNEGGSVTLDNATQDLGGTAKVVFDEETQKYKLQYTRGEGGVKVTGLGNSGKVFVPIVTTAVDENGDADNLSATAENPVDIEVTIENGEGDKVGETVIETAVAEGNVSQTNVPEIEVTEDENGKPTISSTVNTEAALKAAVAAGGDVVLGADITLSEPLEISKDITLDLGAKNLTASACTAFNVKAGTFTIMNGTVKAEASGCDVISIPGNAGEAIVVNVAIGTTLTAGDCAIVVPSANQSTDITINTAGNLSTLSVAEPEGYAAIQANGNSTGVKLNVTGGTITADAVGIYFPCTTDLNISGGTITGGTAVYQKSGTLNISGGKLIADGDKAEYVFNSNGCDETGDALVIEACNYPGGDPEVTITGGEFVSENANAIGSYAGNGVTEKITGFVKGGIFHDASVFEYLAEDANITLGDNITLAEAISITKDATINLNGKTIANTIPLWEEQEDGIAALLTIDGDCDVTITGNGKIDALENDCYAINVINGGKVIIENGEFVGNVSAVQVEDSEAVINGGKFSIKQIWDDGKDPYRYTLNCIDDNFTAGIAKITVTGGEFMEFDPANNQAEGNGTSFMAEGYTTTSKEVEGVTWYVVKATTTTE